ncbi:hypothetical protein HGM15179_013458 [Zosterops borbonicus]|uniref:Uncharacterized protein n=1 Tax=Zosterops borbonicus TaxID=364589 RepID=A0A8K1G8N6_9PASS|nr:hypothetical protein HGM15179_013458 [Zosterops borbonicus]
MSNRETLTNERAVNHQWCDIQQRQVLDSAPGMGQHGCMDRLRMRGWRVAMGREPGVLLDGQLNLDFRIPEIFGLEGTLKPNQCHPLPWAGTPFTVPAPMSNLALDTARDPGAGTASLSTLRIYIIYLNMDLIVKVSDHLKSGRDTSVFPGLATHWKQAGIMLRSRSETLFQQLLYTELKIIDIANSRKHAKCTMNITSKKAATVP